MFAVLGVICLLLALGGVLVLDRTNFLSKLPDFSTYWVMLCFLLTLSGIGMLLGCCLTAVNKLIRLVSLAG